MPSLGHKIISVVLGNAMIVAGVYRHPRCSRRYHDMTLDNQMPPADISSFTASAIESIKYCFAFFW